MPAFAVLYSLKCRSLPHPSSPFVSSSRPFATANAGGVAAGGAGNDGGYRTTSRSWPTPQSLDGAAKQVKVPTLVAGGAKSPGSLKAAVERVHAAIPGSQFRWLEGQTHNLAAEPAAAMAKEFFLGR